MDPLISMTRCVGVLALCLMMTACAAKEKLAAVSNKAGIVSRSHRFSVQINVADSANDNSPVPMDFVAVMDKKLMADVAKLPAKDWFDRRVQIQRDFPGKIEVVSWEWVPGQHAGPITITINPKAKLGYFFANYQNGGDHRAVVDLRWPVVVDLGPADFTVQPLK
jgi:type VI secretion system protein